MDVRFKFMFSREFSLFREFRLLWSHLFCKSIKAGTCNTTSPNFEAINPLMVSNIKVLLYNFKYIKPKKKERELYRVLHHEYIHSCIHNIVRRSTPGEEKIVSLMDH